MFSNVYAILTVTIPLSSSCKLYPIIFSHASAVAFRVDLFVGFWSVDSFFDLSILSCDWALLWLSCSLFLVVLLRMLWHLMGFSKFNGRFTVPFVSNNTLSALTLTSLFGKSSMIFPIFHDPFGMFAFIWIVSPLDGISFASTHGYFKFIYDLSQRLNT